MPLQEHVHRQSHGASRKLVSLTTCFDALISDWEDICCQGKQVKSVVSKDRFNKALGMFNEKTEEREK